MKKILAFIPNKTNATSWYRASGVLNELPKDKFYIEYTDRYQWDKVKGFDTVFIQRPMLLDQIKIIMKCKMMGKRVVLDYDDLMTDIPDSNPFIKYMQVHHKISKADIIYNTTQCLQLADAVMVTTEQLRSEFVKYNQNIFVVPNAHCDYTYPISDKHLTPSNNKIVFWRGTDSHLDDLVVHKEMITQVIKDFPDYKFMFMGFNPTFLTNSFENAEYVSKTYDIIDYFYFLNNLKPCLTIFPLIENNFNQCKSNICALESAYAGSVTVAPYMKEWEDYSLTYASQKDFVLGVRSLLKDKQLRAAWFKKIILNIKEKRVLSKVNKLREEIF